MLKVDLGNFWVWVVCFEKILWSLGFGGCGSGAAEGIL